MNIKLPQNEIPKINRDQDQVKLLVTMRAWLGLNGSGGIQCNTKDIQVRKK